VSKITVEAVGGGFFEVDTSEETCIKFGFRHGDRIKHPTAGIGTVMGVAPPLTGLKPKADVLWFAFESCKGKVLYSDLNRIVPV
jgi:hypothetical protein